jgi:hypothetical protein
MEHLFSPCTRCRDIVESQHVLEEFGDPNPELLRETNLNVSTEEFLSAEKAFTYKDLMFAMLGNHNKIAWLTPHAFVARKDGIVVYSWMRLADSCSFSFSADGEDIIAHARSPEHLLEICDVVVRLLGASVVHSVILKKWRCSDVVLVNAPALAYFMEQCQSLKVLTLHILDMDENHCRVLGACSRPDLEIVLDSCTFTDAAASALAEVLGRNQGPTKLVHCAIDNFVLANGLRGNNRLKNLILHIPSDLEVSNREVLAIADAVRENEGLVDLFLQYHFTISDETWGAICGSLETHPTLEVLDLRCTGGHFDKPAPAVLKFRMQAFVDLLKVNMSIHTVRLDPCYSNHELFRESVNTYLETNGFRRPVHAIQKTRPIAYRAKVLGRALLAVRTDPNRFWMLLSGNAEVAFPSTNVATTPAANLPTPTTADANANTNVAPFDATTSAGASSSDVTPAAGQKRKACA